MNEAYAAVAELLGGDGPESLASPDAICDALWLAAHLPHRARNVADRAPARPVPAGTSAPASSPSTPRAAVAVPEIGRLAYPRDRTGGSDFTRTGYGAALPEVAPLPEALAVGRVLRPLRMRRPSRTRFVVDEPATARRAARTKVWQPVVRPRLERWPDAALVVDGAPSMAIWRQDALALRDLLHQLAAFRDVRGYRMSVEQGATPRLSHRLTTVDHRGDVDAVTELKDPTGRRVIFVVTDGVDENWGNGTYHRALSRLAVTNPVVVVSLVPSRLWPSGGLRTLAGRVLPGNPMQANAAWRHRSHAGGGDAVSREVPIPVVDLSQPRLSKVADVLAGNAGWTLMRVLEPGGPAAPRRPLRAVGAPLQSRLNSGAYRLLLALATMPGLLTMTAIQTVQRRVLPGTGSAELAEALLCGAFEPPGPEFADHDGELRFVSTELAESLSAAAGPVLRTAVLTALGASSRWTTSGTDLIFENEFGKSARVGRSPTEGVPPPGPLPRARLTVWDVACKLPAQSRAYAVRALIDSGLDERELRRLDVRELRRDPDGGVKRLTAAWTDPGTAAIHLDNAQMLRSRLREELLRQIRGRAAGNDLRIEILVLGRRGGGRAAWQSDLAGLGGISYRPEVHHGEEPAVRILRLTLSRVGQADPAFEDHLWLGLSRSVTVAAVRRGDVMNLVNAIVAEVSRRWREHNRLGATAPVTARDLPEDVDAFLRRTL